MKTCGHGKKTVVFVSSLYFLVGVWRIGRSWTFALLEMIPHQALTTSTYKFQVLTVCIIVLRRTWLNQG